MPRVALYPLSFEPIFRPVLWGGRKLMPYKGYPTSAETIGECWEISPLDEHMSVVASGPLQGTSLRTLMESYGKEILGERLYRCHGGRFPLLIKLINAEQDLSVQVHPGRTSPKSEMWYILDASEEARLSAGFRHGVTPEQYLSAINDQRITDLLHYDFIQAGDLFYIPAGCIHTIGAGSFIFEVQQPSDTTYRIFDYHRTDHAGNMRPLHLQQAFEVMNFSSCPPYKRDYSEGKNRLNLLLSTPHFVFSTLLIESPYTFTPPNGEGCAILFTAQGGISIEDNQGQKTLLAQGRSLLIPSSIFPIQVIPSDTASKVLVVTLP